MSLELTEKQIDYLDDLLNRDFNAHFDPGSRTQETNDLLDLIINTRLDLARSLPCAAKRCPENRMGFQSDLCTRHYLQLTRGEFSLKSCREVQSEQEAEEELVG